MTELLQIVAMIFCIGGALSALSAKQLLRGVLGLSLFFLGVSLFFISFDAWFLAVGQVFLFVGGVVTLFVLAFNMSNAPSQPGGWISAGCVALAVAGVLWLFLPGVSTARPVSLEIFASFFFSTYGWILNVAILILFSAIITAQHILSEDDA